MSEAWRNTYDAWKLSGPPENDEPADPFTDFEITLTVTIAVKGSDYYPVDYDGDEAVFRDDLAELARDGVRHHDLNIVSVDVDTVEPPL